uniref:CDP-diacylglycerol--inositol 3-phosphatidyltransferase n=1 Tax=Proboscia inermis TaxID=420281 RepID=A0A7S0BXN6_9STRA|mmetsp:Transcript_14705/g.14891  ORF Transcript_14705/g.14891 Transcript_14705/m.14891 type:complete len:186 (+) Transcript_14705:232-789(+)
MQATILYIASFVGDLFDGAAARFFNQCSEFGGLLDMVTDRCSTLGLLHVLSFEYGDDPNYRILFLLLIILDVSSHWCQMFSTCSMQQHHKSNTGNGGRFFLVRWYYKNYYFFGYCCVGTEFTYIVLYMMSRLALGGNKYASLSILLRNVLMCVGPACIVKQIVNIFQLLSACYAVAENDAKTKSQ